jgi:hypothetical protein
VSQTGESHDTDVIQQTGNGNGGYITQQGGASNTALIVQQTQNVTGGLGAVATGNEAYIEQFMAENSSVSESQLGSGNYATADQGGNLDTSIISQNGLSNQAQVIQYANGSTVKVSQTGTGNVANVLQH